MDTALELPIALPLEHGMRDVYDSVLDCVGNTPLIRLNGVTRGLKATVYAKVEFFNPGGSVKDRIAMKIIDAAEKSGALKPGGTIVEGTSGNTGAGLAMVAALRGYKAIFVLPDKQSEEKRAALRAWGARVVVTPTNVDPEDPRSYYKTAERLVRETPNAFYANQYHNPVNPVAHYESTGPELWNQLDGKIDVFACGIGTGGTITGTGKYLKEQKSDVAIVGIDPVGSLYYDYFHTGQLTQPHTYIVEGIGEDFLPSTMDFQFVDDVVRVNDKECFQMTRRLVNEEGLFCGVSSGAAVAGTLKYLRRHDREGLVAVVLIPDSGIKYMSKVYDDNWMRENGFLQPDRGLGLVSDMLAERKPRELISVRSDAKVTEVIGVLKLHGVSQVPLVDDGKLVGVASEKRLLERALAGTGGDTPAVDVAEANYCTVDLDTEISTLLELYKRFRVAIVLNENNEPFDIITRIDLLDYINQVTTQAASL